MDFIYYHSNAHIPDINLHSFCFHSYSYLHAMLFCMCTHKVDIALGARIIPTERRKKTLIKHQIGLLKIVFIKPKYFKFNADVLILANNNRSLFSVLIKFCFDDLILGVVDPILQSVDYYSEMHNANRTNTIYKTSL